MTPKVDNNLKVEQHVEHKPEEVLELRDRIKQLEKENARLKTQMASSVDLGLGWSVLKKTPQPSQETSKPRSASLGFQPRAGHFSFRSPLEALAGLP